MPIMHLLWWLCIILVVKKIIMILIVLRYIFPKFWKSNLNKWEKVLIYHVDELKIGQILTLKLNLTMKVKVKNPIKR